jgi:hypothetical protein
LYIGRSHLYNHKTIRRWIEAGGHRS